MPDYSTMLVSRRSALGMLGGMTGGILLLSCGGSGGTPAGNTPANAVSVKTRVIPDVQTCRVTPQTQTAQHMIDDTPSAFNRSDIRANLGGGNTQVGIPLTLYITVLDTRNACVGLEGVQLDIWHCNADGIYSGETLEGTVNETWLRGYQMTDSAGQATFATIVPGWSAGRATHIHLRARSKYSIVAAGSDSVQSTQLFFPQELMDGVNGSVSPYKERGINDVTNLTDPVNRAETQGATLLNISGSVNLGYVGSAVLGLPLTDPTI